MLSGKCLDQLLALKSVGNVNNCETALSIEADMKAGKGVFVNRCLHIRENCYNAALFTARVTEC